MINTRIQQYLAIANEITPLHHNPYDLCKELGIEVIDTHKLHKDAYFVCTQGLKLVFVSSCIKNRHRKNFVVSHEIGHYFLHREQLYCCDDIAAEAALPTAIKVNSQYQEHEANTFASEYVLPTSSLQEKLPNREIHFRDISSIANEFDVSVTLTAIKSVQHSRTESESLLCYEDNRLKWFVLSDDDIDKPAIPPLCPFNSLLCAQPMDISGCWDDLYVGSVHQEVFSPFGKQRLILLSGQRRED